MTDVEESEDGKYWARSSGDRLCGIIKNREKRWYDFAERRGYIDMWLSMLTEYYGIQPTALLGFDAANIALEGDQGELVRFRVNEIRSYIRLAVTTTTKQRVAFQAKTTAVESVSEREVDLAESAMDATYHQWFGEKKERRLVERAELFATMWTWLQWEEDGGDPIERPVVLEDGQVTPETTSHPSPAIVAKVLPPWQVITDPTVEYEEDQLWFIVRERRSRWEMIEQYGYEQDPDTGERVESEAYNEIKNTNAYQAHGYEALFGFDDGEVSDDDIVIHHFYHKSCRALQGGRHTVCIGESVVFDEPFGGTIPLLRYQPAEFVGSALGYSDSWDLVVLNQMSTQLTSDAATNLSTFGRQSVTAEKGTEFSEEQLANGMHLIRIPKGAEPPKALMLAELPKATMAFLEFLDKKMQTVSGENSVTRGDPSSNIKSGTMAALFASIAQDYQHGRQVALELHREAVGNLMLDMIREQAPEYLVLEMVGEHQRSFIKDFRADGLRVMRRVGVKPVPATLRTRAGQLEMANFLKDVPGAITTPEQAIEVFTQGQVTPIYNASRAVISRVRWENEKFAKAEVTVQQVPGEPQPGPPVGVDPMTGQPIPGPMVEGPPVEITPECPVFPTDNPFIHVPEHNAELASPEALHNPEKRRAILAHMAWHGRVYMDMSPIMAAFLKIPPPGAVMGGGAPPPEREDKPGAQKPGKLMERAADTGIGLPDLPSPAGAEAAE